MHTNAYRQTTEDACAAIRAAFPSTNVHVTSLAGGYVGILWPLVPDVLPGIDGHVILCRDLDGSGEWIGWGETADGERWSDDWDDAHMIGHVRPRDYAVELAAGAAQVVSEQRARMAAGRTR